MHFVLKAILATLSHCFFRNETNNTKQNRDNLLFYLNCVSSFVGCEDICETAFPSRWLFLNQLLFLQRNSCHQALAWWSNGGIGAHPESVGREQKVTLLSPEISSLQNWYRWANLRVKRFDWFVSWFSRLENACADAKRGIQSVAQARETVPRKIG